MDHRISRREGDKRIKLFLTIKDEILNSQFYNSLSPHAQAYLGSSFLSFIFEKDFLNTLVENAGANGLRIYYAATPSSDPSEIGVPTLVIYPCEITPNNGGGTVVNRFANADPDSEDGGGGEHPGLSPTPLTKDTFDAGGDTGTYEWIDPGNH